ncbi:hypothetical protein EON81_07255 [bacterium]|nr:MAG: hypothetical protein EON81_07255 [bacterium]
MMRYLLCLSILSAALVAPAYQTEATCKGSSACRACKNCKYCKHCSIKGNSCGVCKPPKPGAKKVKVVVVKKASMSCCIPAKKA